MPVKPTIIPVVSPWDTLVHLAQLVLTNDESTGLTEKAILLCREVVRYEALAISRYRVGDDRPVTCIRCIARSQDGT
jgi:hypothetical protein